MLAIERRIVNLSVLVESYIRYLAIERHIVTTQGVSKLLGQVYIMVLTSQRLGRKLRCVGLCIIPK